MNICILGHIYHHYGTLTNEENTVNNTGLKFYSVTHHRNIQTRFTCQFPTCFSLNDYP